MPSGKRVFDITLALILVLPVLTVLAVVISVMAITDGRPFFYVSERMKTPDQAFSLFKIRTLRPGPKNRETSVTGGYEATKISAFGGFLRRSRLDEVPQIFNILRGDISFVGPRPPQRRYVEKYPAIYANTLSRKPGLTGLSTLVFLRHEQQLLQSCPTAEMAEQVYCRRCIPRKFRLDQIYDARQSVMLDIFLIGRTGSLCLRSIRHLIWSRSIRTLGIRHAARSPEAIPDLTGVPANTDQRSAT